MIRYCVEYDPVKYMTLVTYRTDNGPIKNRIYPGHWHGRWVSHDDETVFVQTKSEVLKDITIVKEENMTNKKYGYASGIFAYRHIAMPFIKKVIFNDPATIVLWADGTKTVVKANDEEFDPEKGLAMAIVKRVVYNNKGRYYNLFKDNIDYDELREKKKEKERHFLENNKRDLLSLLDMYDKKPEIVRSLVENGVNPYFIINPDKAQKKVVKTECSSN